jgi:hypothetical protein
MDKLPAIFMSYSLRGEHRKLVQQINQRLKTLIVTQLKWEALDPMEDPGAESVEWKVRDYISRADVIRARQYR